MNDLSNCSSSEPFALRVVGDDMAPEFVDGHVIIVDPGGKISPGCYVVARHQGDGVLVYFGYPQGHEDDAERAVRAGLDIVDAVKTADSGTNDEFEVRIGIATGSVVVGDILKAGSSREIAALGARL